MSLIKCPECEKEISDKAFSCPHCGYQLAGEKNINNDLEVENDTVEINDSNEIIVQEKIKNRKTLKITIAVLVSIVIIILAIAVTYFFATAKSRDYKKAVDLYNSGNYSDSLSIFNNISDYEDSAEYIKKCEYEISINGQFLRSLAKGLEKRWELIDKKETDGKETTTELFRQFIYVEYEQLKSFSDKNFEDEELGKYAKEYINILDKMLGIVKYYGSNYLTFWNEYKPLYDERCVIIKKINDNYNIPIDESKNTELNDLITNGEYVIELLEILNNVNFKKISDEYSYKKYEAVVENTTSTSFSYFCFSINLLDKNGTVVESVTASTDNWSSGSKHKFSFSTYESFDKIEVDSCDYF